jgi:hypothetical protein
MSVPIDSPTPVPISRTSIPRFGPPDPWFHWIFLGLAVTVLGLSCVLNLAEGPLQVIIPGLNRPLPAICTMQLLFGMDCPGCGLTRSFISLAHGNWWDAMRFNPAGPLVFTLVALQIPYRVWQIRRLQRGQPEYSVGSWGSYLIYAVMIALLLQWALRNFAGISF